MNFIIDDETECFVGGEHLFFISHSITWSVNLTDKNAKDFIDFLQNEFDEKNSGSLIFFKESDEGMSNVIIDCLQTRFVVTAKNETLNGLANFIKQEWFKQNG